MLQGTLKPVSNRATWTDSIEVIDDTTGQPFDISAATEIEMQVRDPQDGCGALLDAKMTSGSIVREASTGIFTFTFTKDQMAALRAKTYSVGTVITSGGEAIQVMVGEVPVIEGVVR